MDGQFEARKSISPFRVFTMIFRISAFTLGGGAVLIGIIKDEVLRTGLVSEEEANDMLSLSMAAPGAMGISMSYEAGLALAGIPGAIAGVFGMALPPFLAILVLSGWLLAHMGSGYIGAFFSGASAGLIVVLGAIVWKMVKKSVIGCFRDTILCVDVTAAILFCKVSPVWALIGGTVIGVALSCLPTVKKNVRDQALDAILCVAITAAILSFNISPGWALLCGTVVGMVLSCLPEGGKR